MKKTILLPLFFLLGIFMAVAQTNSSNPENNWDLVNYKGSAAVLIINKDSARIQKNTTVFGFKIRTEKQFVYLIDKENNQKILNILEINKSEIEKKYANGVSLLPAERLLSAAYRFPDQKLLIGATHSIAGDADNNTISELDSALRDQNFSENITAKNDSSKDWIYLILTGVLSLGLGILIGRSTKRKTSVVSNSSIANIPQSNLDKLESENARLQQRIVQSLKQLEELKSIDNAYFEKIFEKIVLPLQESLEKGNQSRTLALLTIASAQLSSISRSKIGKKLKHDDANIQYLINPNSKAKENFPEISTQTAIDKIPHNLSALITLLQENQVKGLDETIVMGYKIKNILK